MKEKFRIISRAISIYVGTPEAFALAIVGILIWACLGPLFHYSDTWQLVVNTTTTIITFLMVFVIQNSQNRDARAIHLKLDELIRAIDQARNNLIDLENLSEAELDLLHLEFCEMQKTTQEKLQVIENKRKRNRK